MRKTSKLFTAALAVPLMAATTAIAGSPLASASDGEPATYRIEFTNTTTGQYLTPPNVAAHPNGVDVWQLNRPASPGVQAVAENGGVGVLAAELTAAVDDAGNGVSLVGADGPLAPGETSFFEITTSEDRISLVSMIICTNDGFGGLADKRLPTKDGQIRNFAVRAYDAGTEINTEMRSDLVPAPFCGEGPGTGESNPALAENGVITRHPTLQGVGDLDPSLDWDGAVGRLRVMRVGPVNNYSVTVENLTGGQYLTPPNWAAHSREADVFQWGEPASPGVQAVAENGGVPVLAAELQGAVDDAGLGVSGVGAEAPIPPGESATFGFATDQSQLSIVSMIVCTNDGFTGLDSKKLPPRVGQTKTYYMRGYDAGTEINTERFADIVPAPFCGGDGVGTDQSNPELAENGVITRHRTLRGVGDLDETLDWMGPVVKITVTNNGAGEG